MKKIILLSLLSLPLFFLAQTNKQFSPQQLKEKELEMEQKQDAIDSENKDVFEKNKIKPTIIAGSKEYNLLKADGKLAHYEVKNIPGKPKSIVKTTYKIKSVLTSTLTPCDNVSPGTIPPFPAPVDDNTYFDETGGYINLPFTFCFYGNNFTEVNYSTNGNIQFPPTNNGSFSSVGFPAPNDQMIAPFWADLDNNGVGQYLIDVFPTYAVFTWTNCGYFNAKSDKTNSFQMVITDGLDPILPPGKNVGFYYGTMQWTTGDASGGTGGFPTTQPGTPATVGMNAGNGIDYFLIGRFGVPGTFYDGPLGNSDGVSWLDGKKFYFNACPPVGANNEPIPTLIGYCDTMRVCGNDTLYVKNTFIAPEVNQTVTITATAPTLGASFSYSVLPNTNSTDIYMIIDGNSAPSGYHTITMSATDNGTPPLTSTQNFVVYVNQLALNNLNASIAITPTLGACPGGIVTASVTVIGGAPDSYFWSNNSGLSGTTYTTVVPADSLIFVTLTSGQCQKTIIGDININPTPVASISGNLSFCNGNASSTVLTATNTLNPSAQGPHTFNWVGTGTLSATNTESPTVNAGVYTVTVTNQFGCSSIATTTVVANDSPKFTLTPINAIFGGSVYCIGPDTVKVAINFGASSNPACGLGTNICVTPNIIPIGSASGANSSTGFPSAYGNYFKNVRHQMLYTAAELIAAGATPGKLSSVSFQVNSMLPLNTTNTSSSTTYIGTLPNYSIKMKCTSNSVLNSTFDAAGLTQVFLGNVTPTVGVNTQVFSQPYIWDGTSNIIVDICYTRTTSLASSYYTSNPVMPYTNTGNTKCVYFSSDVTLACGNTSGTTTNSRPDIKFGNCFAPQSGPQFNIVVTPTTGVVIPASHDTIKFNLPSAPGTICYTVSLINPIGNCTRDTVICIQAMQGITSATLVPTQSIVCIGSPITLNAVGSLATYTITYNNGALVNSVNNPAPFNTAIGGLNIYTLTAQGFCSGPITTYTASVLVNNKLNLSISPMANVTKCLNTSVTLTANVASSTAEPYSYNWLPAIGTSTNSTYLASAAVTTTYVVTVNGTCANTATSAVVVSVFASDINVTIIDSAVVCASKELILHSLTSGGHPAYSFNWTILPNVNSISSGPILNTTSPGNEGTYTVMIVASDSCGFSDFDTQLITVLPPCAIEIGNIITPNGDGANDLFKIKNLDYHPNSSLTIFDRWGRKVYGNQNYTNDWKAEGLNDGTYFYILDVPEDKKYNGFVQVLR
jgi:gliding motility-associated-like protein